jgi:hypothetical protein
MLRKAKIFRTKTHNYNSIYYIFLNIITFYIKIFVETLLYFRIN